MFEDECVDECVCKASRRVSRADFLVLVLVCCYDVVDFGMMVRKSDLIE